MSDETQQSWFDLLSPAAGVHREPPATPHHGIVFERSARARRYRLTLRRDGTAVATIPARGSVREAELFVAQHTEWLERARARQRRRPRAAEVWAIGTRVLWRGELTEIRVAAAEYPNRIECGRRPLAKDEAHERDRSAERLEAAEFRASRFVFY